MDFSGFIHTDFVIGIYIKVIARICLTEDQVEHFEEALCVLIGEAFYKIEFAQVINTPASRLFAILIPPEW